jgi:hypothetical protein
VAPPFPVFVVHDRSLAPRRAPLEAALARLAWRAEWIERPEPTPLSYLSAGASPRLSLPQISVSLKQIEVWRRIAASGAERAFVLEDDATFGEGFAATFDSYLAALPADASSVFFGESCGHEAPPLDGNPRYARVDRTRSLSGYLATAAWCGRMLADLERAPMTQPIDLAVDAVIRRHALATYWSVPAIVGNGSESGVFASAITKGAWRRLRLVRWLARR